MLPPPITTATSHAGLGDAAYLLTMRTMVARLMPIGVIPHQGFA
jgi:hypothetical protein